MDEYEIYDKGVVEFMKVTLDGETNNVFNTFSIGHRAFADIEKLYQQTTGRRIQLPVISIARSDSLPADDRFRFVKSMRLSRRDDAKPCEYIKTTDNPQPVDITYTVDVRAAKEKTLNEIRKKITLKFIKDLAYILFDLQDFGNQRFSLNFQGFNDPSGS